MPPPGEGGSVFFLAARSLAKLAVFGHVARRRSASGCRIEQFPPPVRPPEVKAKVTNEAVTSSVEPAPKLRIDFPLASAMRRRTTSNLTDAAAISDLHI